MNRPVTTADTAAPEQLIRKSEFARLVGVSHAAISKAIRDGRLTPALRQHNGHEVLARAAALRLWAQCRREPLPQVLPDLVEPLSLSPLPELPELAAAIAAGLPPLHESRARREHYASELARLEVERLQAELVPAAQVEVERRQCAATVKAALASWAERLAPQVAAANDPERDPPAAERNAPRGADEAGWGGLSWIPLQLHLVEVQPRCVCHPPRWF